MSPTREAAGAAIVEDASVAIEWVEEERGSDLAARLLDGLPLHAPPPMRIEAADASWAMARRRVLTPDEADDAPATLEGVPSAPHPPGFDPVPRALRLARLLDHPVSDCVNPSLALELGMPVFTPTGASSLRPAISRTRPRSCGRSMLRQGTGCRSGVQARSLRRLKTPKPTRAKRRKRLMGMSRWGALKATSSTSRRRPPVEVDARLEVEIEPAVGFEVAVDGRRQPAIDRRR